MNTETLTKPSPELKQHVQELRRDAGLVAQDVKNQASDGFQEIKTEAQNTVSTLYESIGKFVAAYPLSVFGVGVVTGLVLASRHRK